MSALTDANKDMPYKLHIHTFHFALCVFPHISCPVFIQHLRFKVKEKIALSNAFEKNDPVYERVCACVCAKGKCMQQHMQHRFGKSVSA